MQPSFIKIAEEIACKGKGIHGRVGFATGENRENPIAEQGADGDRAKRPKRSSECGDQGNTVRKDMDMIMAVSQRDWSLVVVALETVVSLTLGALFGFSSAEMRWMLTVLILGLAIARNREVGYPKGSE